MLATTPVDPPVRKPRRWPILLVLEFAGCPRWTTWFSPWPSRRSPPIGRGLVMVIGLAAVSAVVLMRDAKTPVGESELAKESVSA
ncbi:hypothetical protein [Nocardia salmonicida]|uniref:hypothetical protein n=1 Tax=Nocardia salmonicida TaxID=53431 RepID=UPI003409A95C